MDKIINIGILGCANIAKRSVIPALQNLGSYFNIIGIASRNIDTALVYAETVGITAFDGYQSLIDEPSLEAVYIPLPNALHTEWIEKALNRGLHVLVEKSLACMYEDVVRLNNLAQQKGLVLVENFQFRFHSQLATIKELLLAGEIGELRCLRSSFGFPGLPTQTDIRYQQQLGGGALLDTGAYPIKIAQLFLGADIEVVASNMNFVAGKEVDIWGGAYVKQKEGDLFGELAFGFNNFYQCNIELWGSKGKLYTNRIFTAPPGYQPILEIETSEGKNVLELPADNHFENMLIYFYKLIHKECDQIAEYKQNINQSRLVNELKIKANGK